MAENFAALGLKALVVQGITEAGLKIPSELQRKTIPTSLQTSFVATAPKGSGKTTSIAISTCQVVDPTVPSVQVLVICSSPSAASDMVHKINAFGHLSGIVGKIVVSDSSYAEIKGAYVLICCASASTIVTRIGEAKELKWLIIDDAEDHEGLAIENLSEIYFVLQDRIKQVWITAAKKPVGVLALVSSAQLTHI